jgi:nitrate/nitrite transporter NarK
MGPEQMDARRPGMALTLSTLAFAVSFAVWGMVAPMGRHCRARWA